MTKTEKSVLEGLTKRQDILFFLAVTALALLARFGALNFISSDMADFLIPWLENAKAQGGWPAMRSRMGDYNILYQALVCLLSYLPGRPEVLFKAVGIVFDFLLAWVSAGWISDIRQEKRFSPCFNLVYGLVLMLPTVFMNAALWGQCDSMYALFCVISLRALQEEKYPLSFGMLGVAFALKLQTVFILPVYFFYYVRRRNFSILWFFETVAAFWLCALPGFLAGRSLLEPVKVYVQQTAEYQDMILNVGSFWYLVFPKYAHVGKYAIGLTLLILGVFLYFINGNGLELRADGKTMLLVACWTAWTCVFFLPNMHERYTYLVDIFLVLLSAVDKRYIKYALAEIAVSAMTYTNALMGGFGGVLPYASLVLLAAWAHYSYALCKSCRKA